jgi:hypothetical protein
MRSVDLVDGNLQPGPARRAIPHEGLLTAVGLIVGLVGGLFAGIFVVSSPIGQLELGQELGIAVYMIVSVALVGVPYALFIRLAAGRMSFLALGVTLVGAAVSTAGWVWFALTVLSKM